MSHGFIYDGSTFTTIDHPLATNHGFGYGTSLHKISGNRIVGVWVGRDSGPNATIGNFIYSDGQFETLDLPQHFVAYGIDGSRIVGTGTDSTSFILDGTVLTTISYPDGSFTLANDIDGNKIVGSYSVDGYRRGFVATLAELSLDGDYNQDGTVDAADYTVWRDNLGSGTSLPNDDTPGVGQDDYTRWKTNFGEMAGAGGGLAGASPSHAAVPEPATCWLALLAAAAMMAARRTK